jgi:hypothetical protein
MTKTFCDICEGTLKETAFNRYLNLHSANAGKFIGTLRFKVDHPDGFENGQSRIVENDVCDACLAKALREAADKLSQ